MTEAEILERIEHLNDEWTQLDERKDETPDIPIRPIYARQKELSLELNELVDTLLALQEEARK
jgi:hypothetical protein